MKIPLKKTLNILLANFFVKHSLICVYSGICKISEANVSKLNYIRACAKLRFLSKTSFFFKLKYPVYILLTTTNTHFFNLNKLSLVFFQFYKYIVFGLKSKHFFDLSFLKQCLKVFSAYLNTFSFSVLGKK